MSLYVDNVIKCVKTKEWPHRTVCHLSADTAEELKIFAVKYLSLRVAQMKTKYGWNYFVIPATLRKIAIFHGAQKIDKFLILGD